MEALKEAVAVLDGLPPADERVRRRTTVIWVLLHGLAQLQITGHLHEPRTPDGDACLPDLLDTRLQGFLLTSPAAAQGKG